MTYAYRCPVVGLDFADGPGCAWCTTCHEFHDTWLAGAPEPEPGTPFARNDRLAPHYDWAAGQRFTSKSAREAYCKRHGLVLRSYDEHLRNESHNHSKPRAITFGGQKLRRSSAEKRGIVDGHAVR